MRIIYLVHTRLDPKNELHSALTATRWHVSWCICQDWSTPIWPALLPHHKDVCVCVVGPYTRLALTRSNGVERRVRKRSGNKSFVFFQSRANRLLCGEDVVVNSQSQSKVQDTRVCHDSYRWEECTPRGQPRITREFTNSKDADTIRNQIPQYKYYVVTINLP